MIRWEELDRTNIPGERGDLRLMRRGAEYSITLAGNELMNSRLSGSEQALATLVCARIGKRKNVRMLIGGLGMGFTLRAAQAALSDDARIVVAELIPAVVAWAHGSLQPVFGDSLDDGRTDVKESDVGLLISAANSAFDAIVLDVDNGPEGLTRQSNDGLYGAAGLRATWRALTPGGILAVWSSAPSAEFTRRLGRAGFTVEEMKVRARGTRGARHMIWLAQKNQPASVR